MPWNTTSPGNGHVYSRGHHNIVSTRGQRCTLNIFQETVLLGITPECLFPQTCLLMNLQFRRRLNRKSYERFLGTFWRWVKAPDLAWTKICFSMTFLCHLPSRPTQALRSTELFNLSSPPEKWTVWSVGATREWSRKGAGSLGRILSCSFGVLRTVKGPGASEPPPPCFLPPHTHTLGEGGDWDLDLDLDLDLGGPLATSGSRCVTSPSLRGSEAVWVSALRARELNELLPANAQPQACPAGALGAPGGEWRLCNSGRWGFRCGKRLAKSPRNVTVRSFSSLSARANSTLVPCDLSRPVADRSHQLYPTAVWWPAILTTKPGNSFRGMKTEPG